MVTLFYTRPLWVFLCFQLGVALNITIRHVKKGDMVITGQKLGLCGNSGNSTEPHIHFQVMDAKNVMYAISLNIQFGEDSPVQGDYVYSKDILLNKEVKNWTL